MKNNPSSYIFKGALWVIPLLLLCNPVRAITIQFHADLSGPGESPANASPGMGVADVWFDDVGHTMEVKVSFWDLVGVTTASHIHAATVLPNTGTTGVATETPFFENFPIGVMAGSYDNIFDLTMATSFNPAFVTANGGTLASASSALEDALLTDKAYLNIHTKQFPGGEIRGFLHNVPDSASTALLLTIALGGMACFARTQRKMLA